MPKDALPAGDPTTPSSIDIAPRSSAAEEHSAKSERGTVKVPKDLRNAHLEVRKMKEILADRFTDATGLNNSLRRHKVLRIKVSEGQVTRSLRIMDALIRELERRGAKFVSVEGSKLKELRVDGEFIESVLMEETKREERQTKEASPYGRQWEFRATGRLRFEIGQYLPVAGQRIWTDCERWSLDDRLGEIVAALFEVAANMKRWRAQREAQERQREEAARLRREEELRRQAEAGYRTNLEQQAKNWANARDLRGFIEACQDVMNRGGQLMPDGWAARWLAWARQHAERIDPMTNGFLEAEKQRTDRKKC